MLRPAPLPATGEVFLDERGAGRSMRVSWPLLDRAFGPRLDEQSAS